MISPPSTSSPVKARFPNAVGLAVARELCGALNPACERLIVAGSLRRRKPAIGDVEILYLSKTGFGKDPADLFAAIQISLADQAIAALERSGVLERRKNANGSEIFGSKNKLMRHVATGLPVDLFAATEANWFNYLVCRTGPAESNIRIAAAAKAMGWHWNPYGAGFTKYAQLAPMRSEQAVFEFVGLPFKAPADRT